MPPRACLRMTSKQSSTGHRHHYSALMRKTTIRKLNGRSSDEAASSASTSRFALFLVGVALNNACGGRRVDETGAKTAGLNSCRALRRRAKTLQSASSAGQKFCHGLGAGIDVIVASAPLAPHWCAPEGLLL